MTYHEMTGRVVVITGASSGFGKGMARKFAQHGASVVLAARREELLQELAAECKAMGSPALAVPADVSNEADMRHLADAAVASFGHIDVWINNAGVAALGQFDEVPLNDHLQVIATNLNGVIFGSYLALKHFKNRNTGVLINIASALGKMPAPYYASYAASKHGVVGLSACIRQELRENGFEGVHVCTVMPNSNDTPFFDHVANYTGHEAQPIPPLYDPQETIDTVFDLISNPKEEVVVGGIGKMMVATHEMAPKIQERMMQKQAHHEMIDKSPEMSNTSGSLHEPMEEGAEVYGGRLER